MSSDCTSPGPKVFPMDVILCVIWGLLGPVTEKKPKQEDGLRCVNCHRTGFELLWGQPVHL